MGKCLLILDALDILDILDALDNLDNLELLKRSNYACSSGRISSICNCTSPRLCVFSSTE